MVTLTAHLLALVLASWRITDLLMGDVITAPIRTRLPWAFWGCSRCVSVWAGALALGLYLVVPWLNWPLALSWLYLVQQDTRRVQAGPRLIVEPTSEGSRVTNEGVAPDDVRGVLWRALTQV